MSKPTILHSVDPYLFFTGGWVYDQIEPLTRFDPVVLCSKTENLDRFPIAPLFSTLDRPLWARMIDSAGRRLTGGYHWFDYRYRVARKHNVQLVHSHFGYQAWADRTFVRPLDVPHVISFYGADGSELLTRDPRWNQRYKELFSAIQRVVVEGPFFAQTVMALGCPEEKIVVNHLGVRLERLPFKERHMSQDGKVRIYIAGTFREKKGIPYALEAVGRLAKDYPLLHVELVGDANPDMPGDLEEKQRILDIIAHYGLEDRVNQHGFVDFDRLHEIASECDLFLSPSVTAADLDAEGGAPVSLTEMAAMGMPIISTTHCDIPEVVVDGESGLLAEERDVDGLVERLRWMLDNPENWPQMSRAARKHIEKKFDVYKQVEHLQDIYQSLL